jgi:hypothetical protein
VYYINMHVTFFAVSPVYNTLRTDQSTAVSLCPNRSFDASGHRQHAFFAQRQAEDLKPDRQLWPIRIFCKIARFADWHGHRWEQQLTSDDGVGGIIQTGPPARRQYTDYAS